MEAEKLLEIIRTRRSIRHYTAQPVDAHILDGLVEAARWAPSAGNRQPLEIVVISDGDIREALAMAAGRQQFVAEAPVVLVMAANIPRTETRYGDRGRELYCIQDVAAATQNILLLAQSNGLGSCWVGAFDEAEVSDICKFPEYVRPMVMITLGYANEHPDPRPRRETLEIIHHETW